VLRNALGGWLFQSIQVKWNILSQFMRYSYFFLPWRRRRNLPPKVSRPKADKLKTSGSLNHLEPSGLVIALYKDCFAFYVMEYYFQTIERKLLYWIPSWTGGKKKTIPFSDSVYLFIYHYCTYVGQRFIWSSLKMPSHFDENFYTMSCKENWILFQVSVSVFTVKANTILEHYTLNCHLLHVSAVVAITR
jgi:hypothetical protein